MPSKIKSRDEGRLDRASKVLRDMRAVYSQDESKDRTPGQRAWRKEMNENRSAFLNQLTKLESAHRASMAKREKEGQTKGRPLDRPSEAASLAASPPEEDEAEGKVLLLVAQMIANFHKSSPQTRA